LEKNGKNSENSRKNINNKKIAKNWDMKFEKKILLLMSKIKKNYNKENMLFLTHKKFQHQIYLKKFKSIFDIIINFIYFF
jgi:hypothetical protein